MRHEVGYSLVNLTTLCTKPCGLQMLRFSPASHHDVSAIVLVSNSIFLETYRYSVDRSCQLLRTHIAKLCSKNLHSYSDSSL